MLKDVVNEPLGMGKDGPVYLKDVWPSNQEIVDTIRKTLTPEMFRKRYADVFKGDAMWQKMGGSTGMTYKWDDGSTYVKLAPYFENRTTARPT
jgi:aconitate hydratase